jgi:ribonuclease R
MLRTMQKARYAPENLGHFGLARRATRTSLADSPLSRSGRAPRAARGAPRSLSDETRESGPRTAGGRAPHLGDGAARRRRERELLQWKKVKFMADKVGDEFEGYVTGVAAFGCSSS